MTGDRTPYRILIVDDKELDRNGVCYLIRQYGLELEPITAASGSEALDILHQQTVHILLTDVKMPGMTGHDLIAAAKDIQPDLKVIIFSSYENFDYAHKAMDLGVTKYLLKPIKVDKFLTCMQSISLPRRPWSWERSHATVPPEAAHHICPLSIRRPVPALPRPCGAVHSPSQQSGSDDLCTGGWNEPPGAPPYQRFLR